tara:strand:- start:500 stop:682 length:183 start_codon:yes stop_codon:yes gene_type:complete
MPTYRVYLINVHNYETTVVAKNEDEAMEKAQELDYDDIGPELDTNGFEVVDVEYESNIED